MFFGLGFLASLFGVASIIVLAWSSWKYWELDKEVGNKKIRCSGVACIALLVLSIGPFSVADISEEEYKAAAEQGKQVHESKDVGRAPSVKLAFTRETLEQKTKEFEQSPQVVEHMSGKEEFITKTANDIYWEIKIMAKDIYQIPLNDLPSRDECVRHVTNFVRIAKARSLAAELLRQGKKPQDGLTYPFHENPKIRSIVEKSATKARLEADWSGTVEDNSKYLLTLPREIIEGTVGGLISAEIAYSRSHRLMPGGVTEMIGRMYTIKKDIAGYGHQQGAVCLLTTWLLAKGSGVSMEDLTRYIMVGKVEALYEALKAMTTKLVKEHGDKARLHPWNPKLRSRGHTEWEQPEVY